MNLHPFRNYGFVRIQMISTQWSKHYHGRMKKNTVCVIGTNSVASHCLRVIYLIYLSDMYTYVYLCLDDPES